MSGQFTRCRIADARMLTILPAQRIHPYFYCCFVHSPRCKLKKALQELYDVISSNMTKQPNGTFFVAGDFNQTNPRTVLPKFYKHFQILTRGRIILDHVQCAQIFLAAKKLSHILNKNKMLLKVPSHRGHGKYKCCIVGTPTCGLHLDKNQNRESGSLHRTHKCCGQ